jgi:hypothetical protein
MSSEEIPLGCGTLFESVDLFLKNIWIFSLIGIHQTKD